MQTQKTYTSPDGTLTFLVVTDDDGDVSLGFERGTWHTHADILAELQGTSEENAVARYIDDLLNDKSVICIYREPDRLLDITIADLNYDDLEDDLLRKPDNETIEFRYWSGAPYTPKSVQSR